MEEIRIGIIGHGFMGHEHEAMLTQLEGFRVTAIADRDEAQLADVKEGIARCAGASQLLAREDVDVVIISANNNQHLSLVREAAQAGKDIICEKPAAMSTAEFDEMMEIVRAAGVRFTVHQQRRYDPDFRTMKAVYDSKTLGKVYTVKSQLYGFNGNMHDWHVYRSEGGGMLYDWGVHLLDQMLWMIDGKVVSVFADMKNVINDEVDDYFNIQLRFDSGITAQLELGTYYLRDSDRWFERHWFMGGDKGCAYEDGFCPEGKIVRTTGLLQNVSGTRTMTAAGPTRSFGNPRPGLIVTEPLPAVDTAHRNFFENYRRAWHGQEEFLVNASQVRRILALMEAVRMSAQTGRSVPFES